MDLIVKEPISHACNRDCSRCRNHNGDSHGSQEPVLFAQQIRALIKFPTGPFDCKHTKVDLSCMFGGQEFSGTNPSKLRPTLVNKRKNINDADVSETT